MSAKASPTWSSFCDLLKTRELTYTRISRALLHILLGIKKDTFRHEPPFCFAEDSGNISGKAKKERSSTSALYARVLGFQKKDTQILKEIKEYATIPLITKLADARDLTSATQVLLNLDTFASDLYESIITEKFGTPFTNEYQKQLQIPFVKKETFCTSLLRMFVQKVSFSFSSHEEFW